MDHAGPVGIRLYRVDDRSAQTRPRADDSAGFALETHPGRVVVQHGHARGDLHQLHQLRALEDPPQRRLILTA